MRFIGLLSLLLILSSPYYCSGQHQPLAQSRHTSYYTYILKLDKQQTEKFNEDVWKYVTPQNFIYVVDSFPTDSSYRKNLPEGNYLYVHANNRTILAQLHLFHSFRIELISGISNFALSVLDSNGKPIPNALVKVGKNIIPFDTAKKWYFSKKKRMNGLLEVSVGDCVEFNTISNSKNYYRSSKFLRYLRFYTITQVSKLYWDIAGLFGAERDYYRGYYHSYYTSQDKDDKTIEFKYAEKPGYADFNKPKYLPNDTLKCKMYIASKNGKPYNKPCYFFLFKRWGNHQSIISREVKPNVPGSYTFQLQLGDSIQLDEDYNVVLAQKKRNKFYILKEGPFRYEDYQLNKTQYHAKLDKKEYVPGDSIILHASGTDANGLPVLDGSIKVSVTKNLLSSFYKDSIYINDTLWATKIALNDASETRLVIPDSVPPDASADYVMNIVFNNSNFESHDTSINFSINEYAETLELNTANGNIIATHKGKTPPRDVYYLKGLDKDDETVLNHSISFPFSEPLNPLVTEYELICNHRYSELKLTGDSSLIWVSGKRTKDSAYFHVSDPYKVLLHYTLYRKHSEIASGNITSNYKWKEKDDGSDDYFMVCNYMWAGEQREQKGYAIYSDKNLDIEIDQPKTISPGDKVDISVSVKDITGKPVPNMNITAACVNAEFKENSIPAIPYYGESHGYIPFKTRYSTDYYYKEKYCTKNLTPWWMARFKLDTISYYKAIYPEDGFYMQYDPIGKAEAQFAPYVFSYKYQRMLAISMIYIDSDFVYYYHADQSQPYSFIGTPGYHNVRIRLNNRSMIVERLLFRKNYKLQLCIEDTTDNKNVFSYSQKHYLDTYEKRDVESSILHLSNTLGYSTYYIWENKKVRLLSNPGYSYGRYNTIDLGPFRSGGTIHFARQNSFNYRLPLEGGYSYEASPYDYVMMKELREHDPDSLPVYESYEQKTRFGDTAYSLSSIQLNSPYIYILPFIYSPPYETKPNNGTFTFSYKGDSSLFAIAMERNKTDSMNHWLFEGSKKTFYNLAPGKYYFQFISKHNYYFETTVIIHKNSTFCKIFSNPKWTKMDTLSVTYRVLFKKEKIKGINDGYSFGSTKIKVHVTDKKTHEPLPFANVVAHYQGAQVAGTMTNVDGYAELDNLDAGEYTIEVVYMGYKDYSVYGVKVSNNMATHIEVGLEPTMDTAMSVMVVCYRKPLISESITASFADSSEIHAQAASDINSIAGSVPGVYNAHYNVRELGGDLNFRGGRSDANLYIIDGQKVTADQGKSNVEIITGGTAAKYGDETGGIVKINDSITKKDISAKSKRNKYSDYAYWEPDLMTNEKGIANFTVTFPDDITGWKAHAEGMDSKKRTGLGTAYTRSFRKLSAQLELPRFLIVGDQSNAIGKALNYTSIPYNVKRIFTVDNKQPVIKDTILNKAIITSYPVSAGNSDSLRANFEIDLENGYTDAEHRAIPIFPIGVKEKTGTFAALNRDSSFSLSFDTSKGIVVIHMDSDPFDMLQRDIDYLHYYPYECNEQASSKVIGFLAEKQIDSLKGKKFKNEKLLSRLMTKLVAAQNIDGSWGWWQGGKANPWMTAYVIHAIGKATNAGYSIGNYVLPRGYDYLRWSLPISDKNTLLFSLKTLSDAGQPAEYDSLLKHINIDSLTTEQLIIYEIIARKQRLHYDYKKVLDRKKQTLMGNIYWGGTNDYGWYDNSMASSISAFDLFSRDSTKTALCESIFNYLLEQRKYGGYWMNTVQTAKILDVLTPYLMAHYKMSNTLAEVKLTNNHKINQDVKSFPYTSILKDNNLEVSKTGSYPVYFTAYQTVFNPTPLPIDSRFSIKTIFKSNKLKTDTLTPGESLTLLIEVDVKQKGEYLMLSVPIPAGCSYGENENNHSYTEVHREQYKDHTNIYFEELSPGHYEFSVNLQARYAGLYTLNPAQMESMYFPTLNGRNAIRKITVK